MSLFGAISNGVNAVVNTVTNAVDAVTTTAQETEAQAEEVVQNTVNQVFTFTQDTFEEAKKAASKVDLGALVTVRGGRDGISASALGLVGFEAGKKGVSVTHLATTVSFSEKGRVGAELNLLGHRAAVYFQPVDGEATLGAVTVQVDDKEETAGWVVGPYGGQQVPLYLGKRRHRDE